MTETMRERIRRKRKFLGLTQEELGKRSGLSTMSIRRYESGDRVPNYRAVTMIAAGLGCDTSELLTPSEEENMITNHVLEGLSALDFEDSGTQSGTQLIAFYFDLLNDEGKRVAVERVQELTEIAKYRRDNHES